MIEFDVFTKGYLNFLINSEGTHMLEFVVERAITAIRKGDMKLATVYTFPYPRLRKLILLLLWDEAYYDFDLK